MVLQYGQSLPIQALLLLYTPLPAGEGSDNSVSKNNMIHQVRGGRAYELFAIYKVEYRTA